MRLIPDSRGSATILTLLISAIIITVGIGFNWIVKEHLKAAEGLKKKSESMLKAHSAYETLIYSMLSGKITPKDVVFTGGESALGGFPEVKALPLNGKGITVFGDVEIKVQESNGMLSIANPNTEALRRLIKVLDSQSESTRTEETSAATIIDSLLDWMDQDKLSRINGAEDSYYSSEGKPYSARNYPIQYMEELGLIRGIDKELYKRLSPYITLLPNMGFNPNTASDEVLMAYLDMGKEEIERFRQYVSEKPINSNAELFVVTGRRRGYGIEGVYFLPSRFMDITISAGAPKTVYSIRAGIDIRQLPTSPCGVVYWKEE